MNLFRARSSRRAASGLTVIDDHLTIRGDIDTDGTVRIDGRVEGTEHRVGRLIIGARGTIIGNVEAGDVVVAGAIEGNVQAAGRIEIESGASVHGDIRAGAMLLRDGAALHGHVSVVGSRPAQAVEPAMSPLDISRSVLEPDRLSA